MSFYLRFGLNTIKKIMAYRFNAFFKMINRLIFMAVQVCIWEIVYGDDWTRQINTSFGMISLHEMISYTVISHVMYCFIQSYSVNTINSNVSNGNISYLLIRPYSIKIYLFVESICESFVSTMFQSIPLLVFGIIAYDIYIPNFSGIVVFLLFLLNGFMIYYLLTTIAAGSAFWFVQTGPLNALLSGLIKIFSGAWIPVWFFSGIILKISDFIPLKNIYFLPIAIYLNKIDGNKLFEYYIVQVLWVVILFFTMNFVWKKGTKKISIQGG